MNLTLATVKERITANAAIDKIIELLGGRDFLEEEFDSVHVINNELILPFSRGIRRLVITLKPSLKISREGYIAGGMFKGWKIEKSTDVESLDELKTVFDEYNS